MLFGFWFCFVPSLINFSGASMPWINIPKCLVRFNAVNELEYVATPRSKPEQLTCGVFLDFRQNRPPFFRGEKQFTRSDDFGLGERIFRRLFGEQSGGARPQPRRVVGRMGRQNDGHDSGAHFQKVVTPNRKHGVPIIDGLDFRNKITAEFPDVVDYVPYFAGIHREAGAWMSPCPKRYISFIQTFNVLLVNKQESINKRMAHLNVTTRDLIRH